MGKMGLTCLEGYRQLFVLIDSVLQADLFVARGVSPVVFYLSCSAGMLKAPDCRQSPNSRCKNFFFKPVVINKHLCVQTVEW
jgi:hypothetical protein